MSSLCCCRGLLALFGVRGYPMDVVAKAKLDRAKMNRAKQNDYSTMQDGDAESRNGDVVRTEPHKLSDDGSQKSSKSKQRNISRRISSRRQRKIVKKSRRTARSFDDSDTDSSNDSEEESEQVIKKTLRKSLRGSRATLASIESGDSRGSALSKRTQDVNVEHEPGGAPGDIPPPDPSLYSSPPRRYREEDIIEGEADYQSPDTQSQVLQNGAAASRSSLRSQQNGHSTFQFHEDDVSMEGTPRGSRKSRQFQRQAVRKSPRGSPNPSVRSKHSLAPSTAKWEMEDASSIYRERQLGSAYADSDEDELALAQKASEEANRYLGDSDEEMQGQEPISSCGTLDVAVQYYLSEKRLQVTIIEAHDLPSKARGGSSIVQVRAVLLPEKKKKYKTKVQHITAPRFAETFKLTRASPDELRTLALRLRMYGIGKLKDRLIGEAVIRFDELNLIRDPQLTIQLQLEPRTDINRGESMSSLSNIDSRASSMMSLSHGGNPPEILIGLSYNAPTGRLCVEVVKGSHFRNLAMAKPPDTFVKLSLLNSACQEMSQSKTTIRRGQPNPVYKETFFFQVALFQLGEVTLMVSVYNKRTIKKKEMIGWVSMGRNSSSEIDEQHWHEMKEGKGQQVSRWHSLIDT